MFTFLTQLGKFPDRRRGKARSGRLSPARSRNVHLQLEALEERTVMSLVSLSGIVANTGTLTGAFLPPTPTSFGLALIKGLPDTPVRSAALADYQRDGLISRNDMIDIFNKGTSGYTWCTSSEFSSLKSLLFDASVVGMPEYVQILADKTIAKAYDLAQSPAGLGEEIGWEVNNYFLGTVRPDPSYVDNNGHTVTPVYLPDPFVPLWNGSPSWQDVAQGQEGDCWLMASLAEVAARNPGDIMSMFIDNGDGTYTVRFYHGSTPDYVTVDNWLPWSASSLPWQGTGSVYDHPLTALWAALAEKAYAQENAEGWVGSSHPGVDSYQALFLGQPQWALSAITGLSATWDTGYSGGSFWLGLVEPSLPAQPVVNAWSLGQFVVLSTGDSPQSSLVVHNHAYAVLNYDSSGWFTLFNPWGINSTSYPGVIMADATGLANNFNGWAEAGAAAGLGDAQALPIVGLGQTDAKPAVFSQNQTQPNLTPNAPTVFDSPSGFQGDSPLRSQADKAIFSSLSGLKQHRVAPSPTFWDAPMTGLVSELTADLA
jgi:hypothetical protein